MDELQRLDGTLKEIKFINTHIDVIKSNAFDRPEIGSIVFENCYIEHIQNNALTNQVMRKIIQKCKKLLIETNYKKTNYISAAYQSFCIDWVQNRND